MIFSLSNGQIEFRTGYRIKPGTSFAGMTKGAGKALQAYKIGDVETALSNFQAARFLEPSNVGIRMHEGELWLAVSSVLAAEAWGEALDVSQEVHVDRTFNSIIAKTKVYNSETRSWEKNPVATVAIDMLTDGRPNFKLRLMKLLPESKRIAYVDEMFRQPSKIERLPGNLKRQFFEFAVKYGSANLLDYLNSHTEEVHHHWAIYSKVLAAEGDKERACKIIFRNIRRPTLPEPSSVSDTNTLRMNFRLYPSDVMKGTALFQVLMNQNELDEALDVADTMSAVNTLPQYVIYWQAHIFYKQDKFDKCIEAIQPLLEDVD